MTVTDMAAYREMSDDDARTAARRDLRADPSLSGAAVGKRYGRSDEWGRKQKRWVERNGTPERTVPVEPKTVTPPVPVPVPEEKPPAPPAVPAVEPEPQSERRRIDPMVVVTVIAVAVVAVVAMIASYSHTHDLARLAGQSGGLAKVLPAAVDGLVIAGSTSLLVDRRAGRDASPLAWAAVVIGLVSSMAANVVAVDPTLVDLRVVRWVMAGYAPVALAISGHLLLRMLDHRKDPS